MFEEKITSRGFKLLSFVDSYDNECSVQESSCVEPRLWLGVNDADPKTLAFDAMAAGINTNGQTTGWIKLNLADEDLYAMKKCKKCQTEKETYEFYKDDRGKDGLYAKCKTCFNLDRKLKRPKVDVKNLKPRKDLTGKRLGMLLVVNFEIRKKGPNTCEGGWNCRCDCGKMIHATTHRLTCGGLKSCGCSRFSNTGNKNHNWNGYGEISGTMYSRIMFGAAKRGLAFEVDIKYLWELFLKQDRK